MHYNSPDRSTKSTTSHFNVLCVLVNIGFQVLFHSPPGVLFTFPSRYCFSIGHQVVFRLGWWSTLLHTKFLVFGATPDPASQLTISFTGLSPSSVCLPIQFYYCLLWISQSLPHMDCSLWFGLFPFRSPLLWESRFDFFSSAYLDVSVRQVPLVYLFYSIYNVRVLLWRVSTFGHLRIFAHLQLHAAFRSLSRPSSAPDALAFSLRSY